jgi:pilus assembly protein Flp/PilA
MLKLFCYIQSLAATAREREEGQGLVEYTLILALVSIVAITVLTDLGDAIVTKLQTVVDALA